MVGMEAKKAAGVADVQALGAGEKLALGHSIYARRNADESWTFTLRRKVADKLIDKTLTRVESVNKATLSEVRALAEQVRKEAKEAAAVAKEAAPEAAEATEQEGMPANATLEQVWNDYLAAVDEGGKWSERNRAANLHRVNLHFKAWDLWTRPVADIKATDLVRVLSPLRQDTPAQCRKLVGLLNLTFIHAVGHGQRPSSPMPDVVKLLANSSKSAKVTHHPALTEWDALRQLVNAIRNLTGAIADDERPLFVAAWVEAVLDHLTGNAVENAYMRGKLFKQGGRVLAWWASQLLD